MASAERFGSPAIHQTKSQRKQGALSEPSPRARPSRVSIRSSSRLRIQRIGARARISRSSWSGPGFSHGPASIAIASTQLAEPRPSADPAVAPELDELGPVADSSAVLQTAGPGGRQPHSRCGTATGGGAARRSSDLDQTGPGGRGTHGAIGLNRPKARRIEITRRLKPLKLSSCCARDSGVDASGSKTSSPSVPRANQLPDSESGGDGRSPPDSDHSAS